MKISKRDLKRQTELLNLIRSKDRFSDSELETIYTEFNEGMISNVTHGSAFFTPLDLAYDFALMCPTHGILVDICAGMGCLTHAAHTRDYYRQQTKKYICIEINPTFVELGKKLCPYADWYCGSAFDKAIWEDIEKKHGKVTCSISNPPFGTITPMGEEQKQWLQYRGKNFDMGIIELAIKKATYSSFILPTGSVDFTNRNGRGFEKKENKVIDKLKKDTGLDFYMEWPSLDTSVYSQFKNTKIQVEVTTIDSTMTSADFN